MNRIILAVIFSLCCSQLAFADNYSDDANQMAREYLEHKRKMELLKRAQEEAQLKQQIARQYKQCIDTGVAVEECDAMIENMTAAVGVSNVKTQSSSPSYFQRTDSDEDKSGQPSEEDSASMQLLKKLQSDVEDMKSKKARNPTSSASTTRKSVRVPKMLRVVSGKVVFKTSEGEVSARVGDTLPGGFVLKSFSLTRSILMLDGSRYESEISW